MTRVLRWVGTLGLLVVVLSLVDLDEARSVLSTAHTSLLGLALVIALVDRLVMPAKWLLLARVGIPDLSYAEATRAYFAAGFAGTVLPISVGADVLRAVAVGARRGKVAEVASSIVVERVIGIGVAAFLAIAAVALAALVGVDVAFVLAWAVAATGVALLALLPLWPPAKRLVRLPAPWLDGENPVSRFLNRASDAYAAYADRPATLRTFAALTLAEQLHPFVGFSVLAHAFGVEVGWTALLVSIPLIMLVTRLPIAPAGLGVMEGAAVLLLGLFGVGSGEALVLSLGYRLVAFTALLPGALFLGGMSPDHRAHETSAPGPVSELSQPVFAERDDE